MLFQKGGNMTNSRVLIAFLSSLLRYTLLYRFGISPVSRKVEEMKYLKPSFYLDET